MKQYLLMGYATYYAVGGIDDIIGTYDSIEEAKEAVEVNATSYKGTIYLDNYEIIDLKSLKVVLHGDGELDWKDYNKKLYWFDNVEDLKLSRMRQRPINNV